LFAADRFGFALGIAHDERDLRPGLFPFDLESTNGSRGKITLAGGTIKSRER
jgi:hypothetical protein